MTATIEPNVGGPERYTGNIFLTGATGFLGAHLLADLLEHTDARVTCLVRGADDPGARGALARQLDWYFRGRDLVNSARVQVVRGDMALPELGLTTSGYQSMAEQHDVILNAAADVSHVGAASRSFAINTEAVSTLIALARQGRPKTLHHVSTVSVRGDLAEGDALTAFRETHLEEGQTFPGAYAESKFRAEVMLRAAFGSGLRGAVYRVGYVGPHSVTGRYQRNIQQSNTARYLRAAIRLGFVPCPGDETVQLTPCDIVAHGIVLLLTRNAPTGHTYYVENPQLIRKRAVLGVLHAAGYPVRLVDEADFLEKAPLLSQDEESLTVITPPPLSEERPHIPNDSSWSQRELRKLGFQYPRLTGAWLGRFLAHAIEVGFLEAPRFWNISAPIDQPL